MPNVVHEAVIPFPTDEVFAWHMRPGALERLLPPWEDVRVISREGGIDDGGVVRIRGRRGPIKADLTVRHTTFRKDRLFRDEQISGPLQSWVHDHEFEPGGEGGTIVRDRIAWEPPLGAAANIFTRTAIEAELKRFFAFRGRRIAQDMARHALYRGKRLRVAVTGSGGLIGSALCHFLTTGGHEVLRIVRRKPDREAGEIYWDPAERKIEGHRLEGVDAIVHLAGESIAGGKWTPARKEEIRQSRLTGTRLLVAAINRMRTPPEVLVSASAVGYYGDRGTEPLREANRPGRGFLADLCREWETEAARASRSGVRVVQLRIGLVLSPAGGALGTMLLPFKMGIGGRLGTGRQYVSWIDHDDLVALVFHALTTPSLRGPVNATAPYPVPNATFTSVLGRVLRRPTLLPVPSLAVRGLFGEMGTALLLEGARVIPDAARQSDFRFDFEGLEESLRHQLGAAGREGEGDAR